MFDFLVTTDIPAPATDLFIIAVSDHKANAATYEAGKDGYYQAAEFDERLEILNRSTTADPDTLFTKRAEMRQQAAALREKASLAELAATYCQGILQHFPRLFGLSPVGEGDNAHWPPATASPSPAVRDELRRLGLTLHKVEPWRDLQTVHFADRPLKRFQSPIGIAAAE